MDIDMGGAFMPAPVKTCLGAILHQKFEKVIKFKLLKIKAHGPLTTLFPGNFFFCLIGSQKGAEFVIFDRWGLILKITICCFVNSF